MDRYELHDTLTKSVVGRDWSDDLVLVWMALLHLHEIVIRADVLVEGGPSPNGQPIAWAPLTRRGAAECVAKVWPATEERSDPVYWHSLFNLKTPFEDITEMPAEMVQKMMGVKELLMANAIVHDVVLEK